MPRVQIFCITSRQSVFSNLIPYFVPVSYQAGVLATMTLHEQLLLANPIVAKQVVVGAISCMKILQQVCPVTTRNFGRCFFLLYVTDYDIIVNQTKATKSYPQHWNNTDLPGYNITRIPVTNFDTDLDWKLCSTYCSSNPECKSWALSPRKECWLKKKEYARSWNTTKIGWVSGITGIANITERVFPNYAYHWKFWCLICFVSSIWLFMGTHWIAWWRYLWLDDP